MVGSSTSLKAWITWFSLLLVEGLPTMSLHAHGQLSNREDVAIVSYTVISMSWFHPVTSALDWNVRRHCSESCAEVFQGNIGTRHSADVTLDFHVWLSVCTGYILTRLHGISDKPKRIYIIAHYFWNHMCCSFNVFVIMHELNDFTVHSNKPSIYVQVCWISVLFWIV